MSDYGDYSDYGSDHEWMYVEDHYDEAVSCSSEANEARSEADI